MQFYWLSPIIILPLWANWKYGLTWWSIIFATMTGVLGFITKVCRKPPTSIFAAVSFEDYGVDNPYPSYCGKQIFGSDFGPFIRAQVYLIGLLFGWILYKIKGRTIKIPLVSLRSYFIKNYVWNIFCMITTSWLYHNSKINILGFEHGPMASCTGYNGTCCVWSSWSKAWYCPKRISMGTCLRRGRNLSNINHLQLLSTSCMELISLLDYFCLFERIWW